MHRLVMITLDMNTLLAHMASQNRLTMKNILLDFVAYTNFAFGEHYFHTRKDMN